MKDLMQYKNKLDSMGIGVWEIVFKSGVYSW